MKFLKFTLVLLFSLALFNGCSQKSEQTLMSDSHGYLCSQCKLKFFTDENVWADVCPGCKAAGPTLVSKLTCPKDGASWILDSENMMCPKCNQKVESYGLPKSTDLIAWGATKKTQQEVTK